MNTTATILLIIAFAVISEVLTWIVRQMNTFTFAYVEIIRITIIALACVSILCLNQHENQFLKEANEFKYELINTQDSLINLQNDMIRCMENHLAEDHDCDIPMYDGDLKYLLEEQAEKVDSLYNTQL